MQRHWYVFIYKVILGKLPCYLPLHMSLKCVPHGLRSQDMVRTELGKKAFKVYAPSSIFLESLPEAAQASRPSYSQ